MHRQAVTGAGESHACTTERMAAEIQRQVRARERKVGRCAGTGIAYETTT